MTDTKKPNRKRKIAKRIWLNEMEERELKRKAKKAGVSQSGLVRSLIRGYEPKEKPGKEFLKHFANFPLSVTMFINSQQKRIRSDLSTRLCCIKRSGNGESFVRISCAVSFRRTEGKYGSQ